MTNTMPGPTPYLVIYPANTGIAQIYNVGIFLCATAAEARKKAAETFRILQDYIHELDVQQIDCIFDGWTYYT